MGTVLPFAKSKKRKPIAQPTQAMLEAALKRIGWEFVPKRTA